MTVDEKVKEALAGELIAGKLPLPMRDLLTEVAESLEGRTLTIVATAQACADIQSKLDRANARLKLYENEVAGLDILLDEARGRIEAPAQGSMVPWIGITIVSIMTTVGVCWWAWG